MSRRLELIVALDRDLGIGRDGAIPWRLPEDLRRFRALSLGPRSVAPNAVIMGRRTWESLPAAHRPLRGRANLVLTRRPLDVASTPDPERPRTTVEAVRTLVAALALAERRAAPKVVIAGGAGVYAAAAASDLALTLHLTRVDGAFACDVAFPFEPGSTPGWTLAERSAVQTHDELAYRFERWERPPVAE